MLEVGASAHPDRSHVWPILRDVVAEHGSSAHDPGMTDDEARSLWVVSPPGSIDI